MKPRALVLVGAALIAGASTAGNPHWPTPAQRAGAASSAAQNDAYCAAIAPFYWEIGDGSCRLASGSIGGIYDARSQMNVASASKWLYGAYVAQTKATITADDQKFLHLSSGYDDFTNCAGLPTVGECAVAGSNGVYTASADGMFFYGGGHMEQHAANTGLGLATADDLGRAVSSALGIDVSYFSPMVAGGAQTTPYQYAKFLQRVVNGRLKIAPLLGSEPVCTLPGTCATALSSPIPVDMHYSFGHWVEDQPGGDGSFSSAGAFGFYPWISADLSLYGIVARDVETGGSQGYASYLCGHAIRQAWVSGAAQ